MYLTLLGALALTPGTAIAAKVPTPEYKLQLVDYAIQTHDFRFPSGLRILFQEEHTQPIVSITNWFDRGSTYDGDNAAGESVEGIAHTVEHLAFRARHADLPKNWDVIQQLGGVLNASTSTDWTNYMTVAPADSALPLLRIEALRLADGVAGVTEEDVEAEKSIVRNELRMGYEMGSNGSAEWRTAFLHLPTLLFPEGHAYRSTTIGSHETVANIDLDSVQRYVRDNYRPEYSTIAVVGDIDLSNRADINMVFEAFKDVEHLLMAPEEAEQYKALTDPVERNDFMGQWVENILVPHFAKMAQEPAPSRIDCEARAEPPPLQDPEVLTVKGMVNHTAVIAAWTLPGGYCEDLINMNIAASFLRSQIYWALDPEWDPTKQEQEIEGVDCGVLDNRDFSTMVCMIQQGKASSASAEDLHDIISDTLYQQWTIDPMMTQRVDFAYWKSRLGSMSSILNMTDQIASLYGRSFFVARHAHYTGSPNFFSEEITALNAIDFEQAKALAKKYITRDRMARLVIEPMDEEEQARINASSSEADQDNTVSEDTHRAKDDRSRQLFDVDALTPEAIARVTVIPDNASVTSFTLDNGLQVKILEHGEAPLVTVGLRVRGDDTSAPGWGLDSLASTLFSSAPTTNSDATQNLLAVAGNISRREDSITGQASAGNLAELLHKMRWHVEEYDWEMANKSVQLKYWIAQSKKQGKKPENWARRMQDELVLVDHPYGQWETPADYKAWSAFGLSDIREWINTKWQPANAMLVIVGKIDAKETEAQVRAYFDSWAYSGSGTPGALSPPPPPSKQPDRQVLVFDKELGTQTRVSLACQLDYQGDQHAARTDVLREVLSFLAFEKLREEAGLTYGAYAFPFRMWGDTTELYIQSLLQNNGAGYGVEAMLAMVEAGATEGFDAGQVATSKWSVARTMVTGLQSNMQMTSALLRPGRDNPDYYDVYRDTLSKVTVEDLMETLKPCYGHEVVTVVGPVDQVTPQLDERGIAYEVIDWETMYEGQLTRKELKKYHKAKAKAEAEAAKKKAEKAEGETAG